VRNQEEEGVDCGLVCALPCSTCFDGVKNQNEKGSDCGGVCSPCPTCDDGIKNQGERRVDCGGSCPSCSFSKLLGVSLVSFFTLFLLSILLTGFLIFIEIKHHVFFRFFKISQHTSVLLFFHRLSWAFRSPQPVHEKETAELLDALQQCLVKDECDRGVILTEEYFIKVFSLPDSFREEKLHYALEDRKLPFATKELIKDLHHQVKLYRQQKYVTALHAQKVVKTGVSIIKEFKAVL
jgi:hypothetical protein